MEFNVSKCKVMHFGKGNIRYRYIMDKQGLEEVDCKDLGVNVCQDLKASVHCRKAYSKANRMLGLISGTIKYRNPKSLVSLYKSLVRPHLDYCSTVWHPHFSKLQVIVIAGFHISGVCHTKKDFISWDYGL